MEAVYFFEALVPIHKFKRLYNPEDENQQQFMGTLISWAKIDCVLKAFPFRNTFWNKKS
jgi:hypothetical protein